MFQYAFGRRIAALFGQELVLNNERYIRKGMSNRPYALDIFRLPEHKLYSASEVGCALRSNGNPSIHLKERFFHFDQELMESLSIPSFVDESKRTELNVLISGYWQSHLYVDPIREDLRKDFNFRMPLHGEWEQMGAAIMHSEAVMINVRRGDYLQKLEHHGVVSEEYLFASITWMMKHIEHPHFFVFSDDIPWCREHLPDLPDFTFVDEAYYDDKFQLYLQLMSMCKHFIISNSSFAWWAAWLGRFEAKRVIAPLRWFKYAGHDTSTLVDPSWVSI